MNLDFSIELSDRRATIKLSSYLLLIISINFFWLWLAKVVQASESNNLTESSQGRIFERDLARLIF